MAIVKGILVNDGGAPARIMNFEASEAITAGQPVSLLHVASGDCTVQLGDSDDTTTVFMGVALVDAASGDLCSVVTGSGWIGYLICETVAAGDNLMVDTSGTAGALDTAGSNDTDRVVAQALEAQAASGGTLTKCLVL